MITTFKREDLQKILDKEIGFFNEMSLVADKLRTIYTVLGWTHMTSNFDETSELVDRVTESCLSMLTTNKKGDSTISSGGLCVNCWFDGEDYLNVDYSFVLI